MTPADFMRECARYFGAWPTDRPGILETVSGYVTTKQPAFLRALWEQIRATRPVAFGAPDMAALMAVADRAAEYVATHTKQMALEDVRDRAEASNFATFLADHKTVKSEAEPVEYKRPKAFGYLDDIVWNRPVSLSPDFYDETISMEQRMEDYCAKRAVVDRKRAQEGKG